jgi:hypothetical protein
MIFRNRRMVAKTRTHKESRLLNTDTRILGVLGVPRSGTSLTHSILNSSEDIYLSFEHRRLPLLNDSRDDIHTLYYELIRQAHHISRNQFFETENTKPPTYERHYRYWGDKMIFKDSKDFRTLLAKRIRKGAIDRLIVVLRDPRNRYLSYMKWMDQRRKALPLSERDSAYNSIEYEFSRWNAFVEFALSINNASSNSFLFAYEELLSSSSEVVEKLAHFLDVRFPRLELGVVGQTGTDWKASGIFENQLNDRTRRNLEALRSCGINYQVE